MRAMGPIYVVRDLVTRCDSAASSVLETQIRKAVGVDFRNAIACRSNSGIESDCCGVDACIAAFLELAESIPAQSNRVNQAWAE